MKPLLTALILFTTLALTAQFTQQQKMAELDYLIGEWIGTTKSFKNREVTQEGAAFEKISFDLDSSILVIELNSEFLQLHTIITYDEEKEHYLYHVFSKGGAGVYPAYLEGEKLTVQPNKNKRFIFRSTEEGGFQEYGEQLVNGEWVKYFEDTFADSQ